MLCIDFVGGGSPCSAARVATSSRDQTKIATEARDLNEEAPIYLPL